MKKSNEPISRLVRVDNVSFIEILKDMYPVSDEERNSMVEKVRENGILTPILVRQESAENYQCINGQSRVLASIQLGLEFIPATIIDCLAEEVVQRAIEANAQRERSWVTKAKEVKYLVDYATQFLPNLQEEDPELKRAKEWVASQMGYKSKNLVYKLEEMNEKDPIHYALTQLDTGELKSFEQAYRKATGREEPSKEKDKNKDNAHPRCQHFRDANGNICPRFLELQDQLGDDRTNCDPQEDVTDSELESDDSELTNDDEKSEALSDVNNNESDEKGDDDEK